MTERKVSTMKPKNISIDPFANRSSTIMDLITFVGGLATMDEHSITIAIAQKHDWDDENVEFVPKQHSKKKYGKAQRRHNTETAHAKRLRKYGAGWASPEELKERLDSRELGMLMEGEGRHWENWHMDSLYYSGKIVYSNPTKPRKKQQHVKVYEHDGLYKSHQDVLPRIQQLEEDLGWLIVELEEYNLLIAQLKHDIEVASDAIAAIDRLGSIEHAFINKGVSYEKHVSDLRYDAFNRKDELEWKLIDAEIDASKRCIDIQCAVVELEKLKEQLYF